jgi:hypothetical protein
LDDPTNDNAKIIKKELMALGERQAVLNEEIERAKK